MRDQVPLEEEEDSQPAEDPEPWRDRGETVVDAPASRTRRRAVIAMIALALSAALVAFVYKPDPKSDALVLVMIMLSGAMFLGASCAWMGGRRRRVEGSVE